MPRAGLVSRFLKPWAVAAFLGFLAACGGGSVPPEPVSLAVSGVPTAAMTPRQSAQLTATLTYSDSSTQDVTATASWSTSDAAVLSVSSSGAITALAPGQADVLASVQGLGSRAAVRVQPAPAPRLALFAGNLDGPGWVDGLAKEARFSQPGGIAFDGNGNIYVADTGNHTIRKITPDGVVTTLAGAPGQAGSADGVGADARFFEPAAVAADTAGNVYVADKSNHTVRKVTPEGVVSTLAGLAGTYGSADGMGADARFFGPEGVAIDAAGNVYVADTNNLTIRRITPAGQVTTLAGTARQYGSTDGLGAEARFGACITVDFSFPCGPTGLAIDRAGNVYVADSVNFTIRRITPAGQVTTLAGTAGQYGSTDGLGAEARFGDCKSLYGLHVQCWKPTGLATDADGNVLVADTGTQKIRKVAPDGLVTTLNAAWTFNRPRGVAVGVDGSFIVADTDNSTIARIAADGAVIGLTGAPAQSGSVDGLGGDARFSDSYGLRIAVDGAGNLYVADSGNFTIRRISPDGMVSTLAGAAGQWGSADGVGTQARFGYCGVSSFKAIPFCYGPTGIASDGSGNVYVADMGALSTTIRKITAEGVVSTLAFSLETSSVYQPAIAVALDKAGNIYAGGRPTYPAGVYKIAPSGVVTNMAPSITPEGLATDAAGNVYASFDQAIFRVTPSGEVSTLAGSPSNAGSADGTGADARFSTPRGLTVDRAGNVYVADAGNFTVRKVTPAGVVTTVVGRAGLSGFAPGALPGGLNDAFDVAISGSTLYIASPRGVAVVLNVP